MNGHVALIGAFQGFDANINLGGIVFKNLSVEGITVGNQADYRDMLALIDREGIRPVIDRSYPLEALPKALTEMTEGNHFGKIVIDIA